MEALQLYLFDILLVVLMGVAVWRGVRSGLVAGILSIAGAVIGLVIGAYLAPQSAAFFTDPIVKVMATALTLAVSTLVFSWLGTTIGNVAQKRFGKGLVSRVNKIGGGVAAGLGTLLAVWLAAAMISGVAFIGTPYIGSSKILGAMNAVLPPAPSVLSRVQRLLDPTGVPRVFAGTEPRPASTDTKPSKPVADAIAAKVASSVVKVEGRGCGGRLDGSGFMVGDGLIVTNAHVVAGIAHPTIIMSNGSGQPSKPVLFDPKLDLAVLKSPAKGQPLTLADNEAKPGLQAAALGYPGGGSFKVTPSVIRRSVTANGRDIYNRDTSLRTVYELTSDVKPGNSGGPLVTEDGKVAGVVFSKSVNHPGIGYALLASDVVPRIAEAKAQTNPVSTGPCAAS